MARRKPSNWMRQIDERILEHLQDEYSSTPSLMASNVWIRASEEKIRNRCFRLSQIELVSKIGKDTYEITEIGEHYLQGNLNMKVGCTDIRKICADKERIVQEKIGFEEVLEKDVEILSPDDDVFQAQ